MSIEDDHLREVEQATTRVRPPWDPWWCLSCSLHHLASILHEFDPSCWRRYNEV